MNTVKEILDALCEIAPLSQQLDFDNSGFLLGHADAPVERALLSLDVTDEVVDEAIEKGAQLIISHHPLIWDALKNLSDGDRSREKLLRLIEKRIAVISMHTNLDIVEGGVNDVLIELLGAENDGPFEQEGCGRIGQMKEALPLQEFLTLCKNRLRANGLRYCDAGKPVKKIAVFGGAGADALIEAWRCGCDTFVTSDVKYHVFLQARELGVNLIDGDHFCTENPIMAVLQAKLGAAFPRTAFLLSERHAQTAQFF